MSAGHKTTHTLTTAELEDLLDHALADPRVKARLARPYRLVTDKRIPLLGSSSVGGLNVYLDQHLRYSGAAFGVLPVKGRWLDTKPGLIRHERIEQIVEDIFGWPYMPIAHPVATVFEHRDYRQQGFEPADVEAVFASYIRAAEREPLGKGVPTDIDLRPALHDPELLERIRVSQQEQKRAQASVGYVDSSKFPNQRCELCQMFIKPVYGGPACTGVRGPINPGGWCKRFFRGVLGGRLTSD